MINIESINSLPLSPSTIETDIQSLPEDISFPDNFANVLIKQELLNKINSLNKLFEPLENIDISTTIDNLPEHDCDEEELLALFTQYLPIAHKKNDAVDLESTLITLTDNLKSSTPDVMALNGVYFVNPLPEETNLSMLGEKNLVSRDFLQKESVFCRSNQNEQDFGLPTETSDLVEKTLLIENTASEVRADTIPFQRNIDNKTDTHTITRHLTDHSWSKDFSEQIVWMNNKTIPSAEIKINPAHLGPISVRIDVNQDETTIIFTAHNVEVKEAIEASIPRLREMLSSQQLHLVNINISQDSVLDQGRSQSQAFSQMPKNHDCDTESITETTEKTEENQCLISKSLLSLYA